MRKWSERIMRGYAALFILLTALICVGCASADGEVSQERGASYTDNCIYANMNGTFYRFNTDNATASPLCPDPLCGHNDKSCPFFRIKGAPVFRGQYIYYLSGGSDIGGATQLCSFDLKSGRYEVLYTATGGTLSGMNEAGGYAYFDLSRTSDSGTVEFLLVKCNVKSKAVTRLTEAAVPVPQFLVSAHDGRLFWNTGSGEYYSTDTAYQNRIDGDRGYADGLSDGDFAFIVEPTGEIKGVPGSRLPAFRLLRKDLTTGEAVTVIPEMCSFPMIYRDCILYFRFQDTVPLVGYMRDEYSGERIAVTDKSGGKLYMCDPDGTNERLLCDISDSGCTFTGAVGVSGKSGTGDFIGIELYTYDMDGEYVRRGKSALLLVNIKTGENRIVRIDRYA